MSQVSVPVRIDRSLLDGLVAQVILDRPAVRNAFDGSFIESLGQIFADLCAESPEQLRAVVLRGEGPIFSAGADIAWMRAAAELDEAANRLEADRLYGVFELIDRCPVPVIARVQGGAIGGGMGLCAVSDIVIAETGTRFGFTESRLGIIPAVISPFVISKIGESHARALFPGGASFGSEEALRIGLVHRVCVGADALDEAVRTALDGLLASGPVAARAAKAIVREQRELDGNATAELVSRRIASLRVSDEAQEGLQAYLEHRPAAWVPLSEAQRD